MHTHSRTHMHAHARTHAAHTLHARARALYTHARMHRDHGCSPLLLRGRWVSLLLVGSSQLADLPDGDLARLCAELLQWRTSAAAAKRAAGGPGAAGGVTVHVAGLLATRAQCVQVSMALQAKDTVKRNSLHAILACFSLC
jgi:hypothetical protein